MSTRHISDYSKLPLEVVYDLINHDNQTLFTVDQFTLGAPEVVQDNLTSVVATAVRGSGYRGTQQFNYHRVQLAALTALEPEQTMVVADCATYQEVLDKFNEKYGTNVTIDDVTIDGVEPTEAFEQPQGPVMDMVLAAKLGSFVWFGETTFKLRSSDMLLSDALPVTLLDGLWFPNKPEGGEPTDQDEFADLPEGVSVAITGDAEIEGDNEIRVTEEGHVRVFAL